MNRTSTSSKEKQKGGFRDLITSIVTNKINELLGKYLTDFSKDRLEWSLGNPSSLTLKDLKIRNDAFDELRLPVIVDHDSSYVKEVKCELVIIPTQVHIHVKGVRAIVHPNSKFWSSDQWSEFKKKRLVEWEEAQKRIFENLNMKSYKQRKLNMVKNNINITIEDFIIFYEDPFVPKLPCIIRIKIEEFKAVTTNHDFSTEKASSNESVTYRKITLRDFSVALAKLDHNESNFEFFERMYLIRPCSIHIKYTQKHKPVEESEHKIECNVHNMVLNINDLQRQLIEAQSSSLANQSMYKNYEVNKTGSKTTEELWKFLIKSCKNDMNINIASLIRDKTNMDRYIDYYKSCQTIIHAPWLRDKSEDRRKFCFEMEDEYSLEKIINYRTLALYQLRIEAMSYVKARGNVRGRTHLGDLWDYYLNDFESLLGDPYKTVAEEHEIELTPAEKEELNHLIMLDELDIVNSYLNGTSSSRNDKRLHFSIEIEQIRIYIQDTQEDDSTVFRTVNRVECICYRCTTKTEKTEKNHLKSPEIIDEAKKYKQYEHVKSGFNINEDGKYCDSKSVKERTLLVIETSFSGNFLIFRDMHLDKKSSKFSLSDIEIWDPLTLQEENKNSHFKANYGFSSSSELLENLLDGSIQELSIFHPFMFFLQEHQLVPEFEFLLHFKGVNEKNHQLCTCGKKISTQKEFITEFFNCEKANSLHMNEEKSQKYQSMKTAEVNQELLNFFNEIVMPRFTRNCIRWIIGNTFRQKNSAKPFEITGHIGWAGKSSPLQVQFNKSKKKGNGKEFDNIYQKQSITLRDNSNDLEIKLSTETVHNLIKWIMKSETSIKHKNYISTLSASHPKIDYIRTLLTNLKKKGKQLYYILNERKKNKIPTKVDVSIGLIRVYLLETIFNKTSSKILATEVVFDRFKFRTEKKKSHPKTPLSSEKLRLGLERDHKFYNKSSISFNKIEVICCMTPVIRFDVLKVSFNDCLMKAHPFLIESITELNVDSVEINLCEEILGFLGLVATLDFTPIDFTSYQQDEIAKLKSEILKNDKEVLKNQLIYLAQKHFAEDNIGKCPHCIIHHKKICKTFTFSIGESNNKQSGLLLKLTNFLNKEDITLHCPLLCGISEEGVFKSTFSMFATEFNENHLISLNLYEKSNPLNFDPHEISPMFSLEHNTATNIPSICVTSMEYAPPLYLLLSMNQKKDPDIFDVRLLEKVDYFFKTHPKYIKKIKDITLTKDYKSNQELLKKINDYLEKNPEIDEILEKKYDFMKLNIYKIEFFATSPEDMSKIFSVIASLISFQQLYGKYQHSLYCNSHKKHIILKNFINIEKILINCNLESMSIIKDEKFDLSFSIVIENLDIQGLNSRVSLESNYLEIPESSVDFYECTKERNSEGEDTNKYEEVIETIEDLTVVTIDSAVIRINDSEVNIKEVLVMTQNLTTQVQGLLNPYSSYSSNIIKGCLKTSIQAQQIFIKKDESKKHLFYLPYERNLDEHYGISCMLVTETENFKQSRLMSLDVNPLYGYLQAEHLVDIINQTKQLASYLEQVPAIFKIPENYQFHTLKFLEALPFSININFEKVLIELRKAKNRISTIYLENISVSNSPKHEIFDCEIHTFSFESNIKDYSSVIDPLDANMLPIFKFSLIPTQNLYKISFENCKVFILMKFIEDNVNLISFIMKETSENSSNDGKKSVVEVEFLNSAVVLPKSSKHPETISVKFDSAKLSVLDTKESSWKLPMEGQPVETTEKDVSLIQAQKEKLINCSHLVIVFKELETFYCDSKFGSVREASIEVLIPTNPMTDSFILKNKVTLTLRKANLGLSLYQMKFLEDLINTNLDEPLEGQEKKFKTKNTKFKFVVSKGKIGISRWVTKPWENMNVVRISRSTERENDSLIENSEQSSQKDFLEDSQDKNPFDLVGDKKNSFDEKSNDGSRSLDEPEKESDELNQLFKDMFDTV